MVDNFPVLPLDLPRLNLPDASSLIGLPEFSGLPDVGALPTPAWLIIGIVIAAMLIVVARRIRRLILFAGVAAATVLVAWNAGFFPLTS